MGTNSSWSEGFCVGCLRCERTVRNKMEWLRYFGFFRYSRAIIRANVWKETKWATESITLSGGSSCFLIGQNKTGLVSYISLLLGETGGFIIFRSGVACLLTIYSPVVVALTLWQGFRESHCTHSFSILLRATTTNALGRFEAWILRGNPERSHNLPSWW